MANREEKRIKVKALIEDGSIKTIEEVKIFMGPTALANVLATNTEIIANRIDHPEMFRIQELYALAKYFEVSPLVIFSIIDKQYHLNHSKKKK